MNRLYKIRFRVYSFYFLVLTSSLFLIFHANFNIFIRNKFFKRKKLRLAFDSKLHLIVNLCIIFINFLMASFKGYLSTYKFNFFPDNHNF